MDKIPLEWAPVIAAAWLDDEFRAKLKYNPKLAFKDFDLTYSGPEQFTVPPFPSINNDSMEESCTIKQLKKGTGILIPNTCTHTVYLSPKKVLIRNPIPISEDNSTKNYDKMILDRPLSNGKALNFDVISAV